MNVAPFQAAMPRPELPAFDHAPIVTRLAAGMGEHWQPADWLTRALQAASADDGDPLRAAGMLWRFWRPSNPVARRALAQALQAQRSPEPLAELRAWLRSAAVAPHLEDAEQRLHARVRELELRLEEPTDLLPLLELREHIADLSVALHLAGRPVCVDLPTLDARAAAKTLTPTRIPIALSPDWNEKLWAVSIAQPDAWWCAFRLVD